MKREEYNKCITPYMTGTGKTREERQQSMCIGGKLCTGRAKDREEAKAICAEAAANPKPLKAKKGRKSGECAIAVGLLAACVIDGMTGKEITLANLTPIIAGCTGQKVEKTLTRERFIKKCFKENAVTGDIKEAQKLRSMCTAQWKEREASL